MDGVCVASRSGLRFDFPERLPSLSEYLCDDFPSPQLKEDGDGNLFVQLEKDSPSQTNAFLRGFEGSLEEEKAQEKEVGRTWISLEPKPVYPVSVSASKFGSNVGRSTKPDLQVVSKVSVAQSNCFRSVPEVTDSFDFSTIGSVSWSGFPTQVDSFGLSLSSSLPHFSSVDVTPTTRICPDISVSSHANRNCAVTWSDASSTSPPQETTIYERTSVSAVTRKRPLKTTMNLDDLEAQKLELKRAKNREAAQRCQQRKQERISRLEGKVSRLREQNVALAHTVTGLREQINWLQRQIVTHSNNGCHISMPRFAPSRLNQV